MKSEPPVKRLSRFRKWSIKFPFPPPKKKVMAAMVSDAAAVSRPPPDEQAEKQIGVVRSVVGPMVVADGLYGCAIYEVVIVGCSRLLGEVIALHGSLASIQLFEYGIGLAVGDPVWRTGSPLNVELGPGLMSNFFDGLQRPLLSGGEWTELFGSTRTPQDEAGERTSSSALDVSKVWPFTPKLRVGDRASGGSIFGQVLETSLVSDHGIMIPPTALGGRVTYVAPAGDYSLTDEVLAVEDPNGGADHRFSMVHKWPVRQPRPSSSLTNGQALNGGDPPRPLIMGQRVLDALFPVLQGGTCAMPGAWGKSIIRYSLSKYSNCTPVVYVGCGERGNEMGEHCVDLAYITASTSGVANSHPVATPILQRTCVIANTANMSVGAREASLNTGVTIAEYYRDMGKHVAVMADSTSRWAEALSEMALARGELPGAGGFPTSVNSRLAAFYARAGSRNCLGDPSRIGSVTILGTVTPPYGEPDDPIVSATFAAVQTFWGIDWRLATKKHFPSINWNTSWSRDVSTLQPYLSSLLHEIGFPECDFLLIRSRLLAVLKREDQLCADDGELRQIGKDALNERDKVVLDVARMIREDFLQQNTFTTYDTYCPLYKTMWMMLNLVTFYEEAVATVCGGDGGELATAEGWRLSESHDVATSPSTRPSTSRPSSRWMNVRVVAEPLVRALQEMKFRSPRDGEGANVAAFKELHHRIGEVFYDLRLASRVR